MQYRSFGKTGLNVSALGFGVMRLLSDDSGHVDQKLADKLIHTAYERGVNYYDTAQNYLNGESETVLGKSLKGLRDKVIVASKVGTWHLKGNGLDDVEQHFAGQLTRLQTDYIDCYLLHALDEQRWLQFEALGILDWLQRKQSAGSIRFLGFSYHGTEAFYQRLVKAFDWDFAQIQYNYVDREFQAGEKGLLANAAKGIGTVVMEPLRGGSLTNQLPQPMADHLRAANPTRSFADWALNYLWDRREVGVVISGMNCMEHLEENLALAEQSSVESLSETERTALQQAGELFKRLLKSPCTACGYCTPECPQSIDIPDYMHAYNEHALFQNEFHKSGYLRRIEKDNPCIACGACSMVCPQGIDIPAMLEAMRGYFVDAT